MMHGERVGGVYWSPEVAQFLDEVRFGVLATVNEDGTAQQTVMWYRRDGDTITMNTKLGRRKYRNLYRDGRASICIEEGQRYVTVYGTISIDEDRERGQEGMRVMTTRYEGAEEAERLMREMYSKQHRINLTLTPEKIDVHGFE
jgi:PPOX class probable F420-dependent enzyme